MNTYTCYMKLKEPSKYGAQERQIKIQSMTIYCAKKDVQFQFPDFNIIKIKRENNGLSF